MKYIFIGFIFLLAACDSSRVYEDYVDLKEAFWHADSIKSFEFDIEDTTRRYSLYATFRNASSYPFYNLYYQYSLTDSLDSLIIEELKEVEFFNPKTGEPYGSGLGDMFDHKVTLQEDFRFSKTGLHAIKLQQFMRRDTLPFIMSVGARVEFVEEED